MEPVKQVAFQTNFDKSYNCFDIATDLLTQIFHRHHQLMFLNSWGFSFCDLANQSLAKGLDPMFGDNLLPLEYYHGIKLTLHQFKSVELAWEYLIHEITTKQYAIISTDTYWCPWNPRYQKINRPHYVLVVGLKKSEKKLLCLDKEAFITKQTPAELPFDDLIKSFDGFFSYDLLPENDTYTVCEVINNVIKRYITQEDSTLPLSKQYLDKKYTADYSTQAEVKISSRNSVKMYFLQIVQFAKALDGRNLNEEWSGYENVNDAPFFRKLSDIYQGRRKFAIFLDFLADQFNSIKVKQLAYEMNLISKNWQNIRFLFLQYSQDLLTNPLSIVIDKIQEMSEREERFVWSLFSLIS